MGVETASFNGGAKSLFGAALELLKMEFTRNIEGKDAVSDGIQGVVNSGRTLVQGVLEVGPVIWHSVAGALGRKQEFAVQERDGLINGVSNAVGNTITELKNRKFLSAIYTLLAEIFPDAIVRDLMQGHTIKATPQS